MRTIADYLAQNGKQLAEEIVDAWTDLGRREPWHRLPENLDQDHLPQLIPAIGDAALRTLFGEAERRHLLDLGVKHGMHRYTEGVAEEILAREWELLRWALWHRIRHLAPLSDASEAIIRIDSALTFVQGASLRGYHRHNIEATSDWDEMLARFLDDWRLRM